MPSNLLPQSSAHALPPLPPPNLLTPAHPQTLAQMLLLSRWSPVLTSIKSSGAGLRPPLLLLMSLPRCTRTLCYPVCIPSHPLYACSCSCLILLNTMNCSPAGFSVHGISQAKILEWVATYNTRESSRCRDWISVSCVSCIGRWILLPLLYLGSPYSRLFILWGQRLIQLVYYCHPRACIE